jgi:hypothetical protein
MRLFWANPATPSYQTPIHPALTSFADECCGMLARLIAYLGALALLAMVSIHLWDQLPIAEADEPSVAAGWSVAARSHPAFAVSQFDLPDKTETYEIFRHPLGGRKDVIRWAARDRKPDEKPVAELEIYRPGGEFGQSLPTAADLAARMDSDGGRELEAAGLIDSKFGAVTLLRRAAGRTEEARRSCLAFLRRAEEPHLQISGWSCQGNALPAQRAAIGCMLNRLVLLTAGNEPRLAEFFARAELRRGSCGSAAPSMDWVNSAENPLLRGTL